MVISDLNNMTNKQIFRTIAKLIHPDVSEYPNRMFQNFLELKDNKEKMIRFITKKKILKGEKMIDIGTLIKFKKTTRREVIEHTGIVVSIEKKFSKRISAHEFTFKVYEVNYDVIVSIKTVNPDKRFTVLGIAENKDTEEALKFFTYLEDSNKRYNDAKEKASMELFKVLKIERNHDYSSEKLKIKVEGRELRWYNVKRTTAKSLIVEDYNNKTGEKRIPIEKVKEVWF